MPQAGTAGPVPDCALFDGGGTTITIVYRAIIQDDYAATFPSGDPSVDEGDMLANTVEIEGDLLERDRRSRRPAPMRRQQRTRKSSSSRAR